MLPLSRYLELEQNQEQRDFTQTQLYAVLLPVLLQIALLVKKRSETKHRSSHLRHRVTQYLAPCLLLRCVVSLSPQRSCGYRRHLANREHCFRLSALPAPLATPLGSAIRFGNARLGFDAAMCVTLGSNIFHHSVTNPPIQTGSPRRAEKPPKGQAPPDNIL